MTNHIVDLNAGSFEIRRITGRLVIQRRWNGLLLFPHIYMTQAVELSGGDARAHKGRNVIEHFAGELSGDSHPGDILFVLERNLHGAPWWFLNRFVQNMKNITL